MVKRVAFKQEEKRTAYVQQNFTSGGINLADLRELVEVTQDFDLYSHVTLERSRIEVVEHKGGIWRRLPERSADD